MSWLTKVRATSFEHMYMLDHWPDPLPEPPPHDLWQAPFVFARSDAPLGELAARMLRAGELWFANHDMCAHNELIIAHAEVPWFCGFQRAARPDEAHIRIGPLPLRVLAPADATPLLHLPLVFRESLQASSRQLWQRLAGQTK